MKYTEQILFILSCGILTWQAWGLDYDSKSNYKKGLLAVVYVIFTESILKGEILFFNRYSAFWRATLRVAVLYLSGLIFLSFQNEKDARQILRDIYPELGKPVPKEFHTYDDHCDMTWANFLSDFDHYYVMHLVGWFIATLLVRDRWIMHCWHVWDEVIELSFQHILPHFAECWWDHVFTDILFSNIPAVELGMLTLKLLKWKKYDWFGLKGASSFRDWDVLKNHRRFGALLQIFTVVTVNFLCGFFLINSLWIPPQNPMNIFRLIIWFLTTNMGFRELYQDIDTWGTVERIKNPVSGKARWICVFMLITETFVSVKFMKDAGNWNEDFVTPMYIWLPWLILIVASYSFYVYLRFYGVRIHKYPIEYYEARNQNIAKKPAKEIVLINELINKDDLTKIRSDSFERTAMLQLTQQQIQNKQQQKQSKMSNGKKKEKKQN